MRSIGKRILENVLILIGTLLVLVPTSPANMLHTYRDSGVFLYSGWRILNGDLPYLTFWDHKPPIIFYINAIGLAMNSTNRWGVWFIEILSLFIASFIGFNLVKRILGFFPALISLILWLATLVLTIQGGNLTTEYTLPLQFAALMLISRDKNHHILVRYFLIGLLGGIAFFTKQTAIGIWLAIGIYLLTSGIRSKSKQKIQQLLKILYMSSGFILVTVIVIIVYSLQGVLVPFFDAAFIYNFSYSLSITSLSSRLSPLITGVDPLLKTGLFQTGILGVAIYILIRLSKGAFHFIEHDLLFLICALDIPIELLLISASGYSFPHYYMTILPALSIFAPLPFWVILSWLSSKINSIKSNDAFATLIVIIIMWTSVSNYERTVLAYKSVNDDPKISFIQQHTQPEDRVLLWGAEASINFFSKRLSPGKYVYQFPLYKIGYTEEEKIDNFLDDIELNHTKLIIDTKNRATPICDFPVPSISLETKCRNIIGKYQIIGSVGDWVVYENIYGN